MNKRFAIQNLRVWNAGIWTPYETKTNVFLTLHIDQLLITSDYDGKILESLNMNGKIKGVYKDDVLVLIISENSQELGLHFPVSKYQSTRIKKNIKFRNINEHFQTALNKIENENLNFQLPNNYKDFVKVCLLDPAFPQIVNETQNILNNADVFESKTT